MPVILPKEHHDSWLSGGLRPGRGVGDGAREYCALSPIFEKEFSNHSYGFQPERSAQDAVRAAQEYVKAGKGWVVDIDLKAFFDQVNHDKLMNLVGRKIRDKTILKLIGKYLRAPMLQGVGSLSIQLCSAYILRDTAACLGQPPDINPENKDPE